LNYSLRYEVVDLLGRHLPPLLSPLLLGLFLRRFAPNCPFLIFPTCFNPLVQSSFSPRPGPPIIEDVTSRLRSEPLGNPYCEVIGRMPPCPWLHSSLFFYGIQNHRPIIAINTSDQLGRDALEDCLSSALRIQLLSRSFIPTPGSSRLRFPYRSYDDGAIYTRCGRTRDPIFPFFFWSPPVFSHPRPFHRRLPVINGASLLSWRRRLPFF